MRLKTRAINSDYEGKLDPTTLAVIKGALQAAVDEMDTLFSATAFSPIISDSWDRSSGIYEAETGEVIAQGSTSLPLFIGTMQFTVQAVIAAFPDPNPGDIYIVNDPYIGGTHLNDVRLVMPVFISGRLLCYVANCGHWPDIGGMSPGGYATDATDVRQEGVHIPPLKLAEDGRLVKQIISLVLANIRGKPSDRRGDIDAQINGLKFGESRVRAIIDKFGEDTFRDAVKELGERSEGLMRRVIRSIPDGTYEAEEWLDSDGVSLEPIPLQLQVVVADDRILFDLTNSPGPVEGPLNAPLPATKTACYIGLFHLWPELQVNGGAFRPVEFKVPEQSICRAQFPSPISGCTTETVQRIAGMVMLALAPAVPDRAVAGFFGTSTIYTLAGIDPATADEYVTIAFIGGGYGGSRMSDGLQNASTVLSMARGPSLEILENRFPLLYTRYELRPDSGGGGHHRGGSGTQLEFILRRGKARFSLLGDRGRHGPQGLEGGLPGAVAEHEFMLSGERFVPPHLTKINNLALCEGDRVSFQTPGGGGYGDPKKRPADSVVVDVRTQLVSVEAARETYGVVCTLLEDGTVMVDEEATRELRGG